jgi:uncharacterized cupredoxin-like copper-binding protein
MKLNRPTIAAAALTAALLGAAVAGVVAHAGPSSTTVTVTEREFKITPSTHKVPAGPVRLVVKNAGRYSHALAIAGKGLSKRTPMIKPGKSAVLLVTIKSGTYSLWCPVPGHAAQGMKSSLFAVQSVSGGGSAGGVTTSSGGTTTDDSGGGAAWG